MNEVCYALLIETFAVVHVLIQELLVYICVLGKRVVPFPFTVFRYAIIQIRHNDLNKNAHVCFCLFFM